MLYRILLSIFIIALITSNATAQKSKKEETPKLKSIPADFTDPKYVLLVQINPPTEEQIKNHPSSEERVRSWWEKHNNEKKSYVKKKLKVAYEVVTSSDIWAADSKYDVNKYRYALIDSSRVITISRTSRGSVIPQDYSSDFHQYYIWDRLTNTLHPGVGVGRGTEIKAFKSAIDRLADAKKP